MGEARKGDLRSGVGTEEEKVGAPHTVVDAGELSEDGSGVRREELAYKDAAQAATTSFIVLIWRLNSSGKAASSSRMQHCRSFRHSSDLWKEGETSR